MFALICNNLANIAISTCSTLIVINLFTENVGLATTLVTILVTIIILIFGEIVPKSRAKENAEKFTIRYAKVLFFVIKLLTPFVKVFMWLNKVLVKKNKNETITVTESELESIIDTMAEVGVIDSDDADLMQSVLDISERTIYDIMVPRVDIIAIDVEMTVEEIKNIFFEYKFSRLPVYREDKDHIIGILSERDFFTHLLQKGENVNVLELVTRPLYVSKTMKVDDLIRRMQIEKKHFAIVSDEYGGTSGIVTMEDALEEIVGEIYDEHDESEEDTEIIKIDDNTYNLSADVPLDDLFQTLELGKAPESSYTNLGGFLYSLAEQVPTEGEQLNWIANCLEESEDELLEEQKKNLLFTILEVKERRIIRVKLEISEIEQEEENDDPIEE